MSGVGTCGLCEEVRLRYHVNDFLICKSMSQPPFRKVALHKCARKAWWLPRTVQPCPWSLRRSCLWPPTVFLSLKLSSLSRYSRMVMDGVSLAQGTLPLSPFLLLETLHIKPTGCWGQLSTLLDTEGQGTGF